jgi:thiamine pyrophosphokinase
MQNALIFANGDLNDGPALRRALAQPGLIIAADGGAEHAVHLGLSVALLVGDMDSISPATLASIEQSGAEVQRHPPAKDQTDFELALLAAAEHDRESIRVIGAMGGRLDHMLANIYLLNLPQLAGRDVRFVAGAQTTWLLNPGEHELPGDLDDTISLIPLTETAEGISTRGLYYPLRDETLRFGPARGISNLISEASPAMSFRAGKLIVVHTMGPADE